MGYSRAGRQVERELTMLVNSNTVDLPQREWYEQELLAGLQRSSRG
jgi:hypothetical protein